MKGFLKVLGVFVAFLMAILLFAVSVVGIAGSALARIADEAYINAFVIDLLTDGVPNDLSDYVPPVNGGDASEGESVESVFDALVTIVDSLDIDENSATLAKGILTNEEFTNFVAEYVSGYVSGIITSDNETEAFSEAFNKFNEENPEFLDNVTDEIYDYDPSMDKDTLKENVNTVVNEFSKTLDEVIPPADELAKQSGISDIMDILNKVLGLFESTAFHMIIIVACVLLLAIIALCKWDVCAPLIWGGIPFVISGGFFTVIGIILPKALATAMHELNLGDGLDTSTGDMLNAGLVFGKKVIDLVAGPFARFGFFVLFAGTAMLIVHVLIKAIRKHLKARKADAKKEAKKKAKKENEKAASSVEDVLEEMISEIEAEDAPTEEAPIEETPIEEAPVEEAPVEETPVEETPTEEAPVEAAPAEEAPVEEAPVEEATVEEAPVEATPIEEAPKEAAPVEETPAEETPVEETPAEEATVEETKPE